MGATAGGMHLFPRNHVAGTHRVLLALTVFASTLAHTNTSQGRVGEAAMVIGKLEIGCRFPGTIIGPQSQVLVNAIRVYDLSGIHLPVWIPNGLKFAKRFDQFRPKHLVEKFRLRLPVTMLTRN